MVHYAPMDRVGKKLEVSIHVEKITFAVQGGHTGWTFITGFTGGSNKKDSSQSVDIRYK